MTSVPSPDRIIIAGGGLAGCLTALALAERRPEVDLLLVEGSDRLGGNHVWSFFRSDVADEAWPLIAPLVSAGWDSYEVRFPAHRRRIDQPYHSIRSEQLDAVMRARLGPGRLCLGAPIAAADSDGVDLASGERLEGAVVDARGVDSLSGLEVGWQKFLGVDFRFEAPHGVERPVIMDATVPQIDGYRFVYLLPFSATELLVEDTYYSDDPALDIERLRARIGDYVDALALPPREAMREETGVLPVAKTGALGQLLAKGGAAAKAGMRGGFFHPTTGYSLPDAVRMAVLIAGRDRLDGESLKAMTEREAHRLWRRRGFYRMLNRMLFDAALPDRRYRVLQRFYRLSPGLIGRFYAGETGFADKMRILAGRPPVPLGRALKAIFG